MIVTDVLAVTVIAMIAAGAVWALVTILTDE